MRTHCICQTCGAPFVADSWRVERGNARFCSKGCRRQLGSLRERLLARREIGPPPPHCPELGPCWLWTGGAHYQFGYGVITYERRVIAVHRLAAQEFLGIDIATTQVLHHCDMPRCFNPKHLFSGTQADNMQDAAAKGRTSRGEARPNAKLRDVDIPEIRAQLAVRLESGETFAQIGARFGVTGGAIYAIARSRAWRHV